MEKTKGIIFYTDCRIEDPIRSLVQKSLLVSGLPIVSCSLKPMDFGKNVVLEGRQRSYPTMVEQIYTALTNLDTDYVFFCEHDVLYHPSHFDFIPERDDVYYYNINNWRWWFGHDTAISYDGLTSLSGMCCNRELAVRHYELRRRLIKEQGLDEIRSREPRWARKFGYEPGTKKMRRGGVTDEDHVKRRSGMPNIDIRHYGTFSHPKVSLADFKNKPENWQERRIEDIPGWDLRGLFNLKKQ